MASTLLTKGQEATSSLAAMYTVGAGKTSMVFQIIASNKTTNVTPTVTIKWNDGTTDFTIVEGATLPIGGALNVIPNAKKLLAAGNILKIQSSDTSAVDVSIDYVEIS